MPGMRTPALLPHPRSARATASLSNIILRLLRLFHDVYRPVPIHTKRKAERGQLRIVELRPSGQGKVEMGTILIGTASWTDKSLIASGRFYPAKCSSPEERLRSRSNASVTAACLPSNQVLLRNSMAS